MKTVYLLTWNTDGSYGKPFGVFNSKAEMEGAIDRAAKAINSTIEDLKLDTYLYELPLNRLVDTDCNVVFD